MHKAFKFCAFFLAENGKLARSRYSGANKLALWRRRRASFMAAHSKECFMARAIEG